MKCGAAGKSHRAGVGRAPRGARGLKYICCVRGVDCRVGSCPSRGTWIEIRLYALAVYCLRVVPLAGHVD